MAEKSRKLWGGYVDGVLDVRQVDSGFGGWGNNFTLQPAIFTSRADAIAEYSDVRPVAISEVVNADKAA